VIAIVGAGIFGVTAALALRRRGHAVTLLDPGPIPHPLAESTDISKVIRADYGADEEYAAWMEGALDGWRRWNAAWGAPLFHETGVMFVCRAPMAPGGFEHESFGLLRRRGHALERLDATAIAARFPAWAAGAYVDGYFNPSGGWAESGQVVARLVAEAAAAGVVVRGGARATRVVAGGVVVDEERIAAERVVVAAGSWSQHLVPSLAAQLRSVGQPVFHLAPADAAPYAAARFPVFGADISRTGWYGFPATPAGVVKIANHGVGREMHPEAAERQVTPGETQALRAFLRATFPALADAPIAATRVCVYGDSVDEHFLIARHPDVEGLVVAAGGSGHGFKFAPLLGDWIADAVEGDAAPAKFRWRAGLATGGQEAARHR
jgi:glycine/D-amino acid oxidase-like deaminating enzyme